MALADEIVTVKFEIKLGHWYCTEQMYTKPVIESAKVGFYRVYARKFIVETHDVKKAHYRFEKICLPKSLDSEQRIMFG